MKKNQNKTVFVGSFSSRNVEVIQQRKSGRSIRYTSWITKIKGEQTFPFVDILVQDDYIYFSNIPMENRKEIFGIIKKSYDSENNLIEKNLPEKYKVNENIKVVTAAMDRFNGVITDIYFPKKLKPIWRPKILYFFKKEKESLKYPFYEEGRLLFVETRNHRSNFSKNSFGKIMKNETEELFLEKIQTPERTGIFSLKQKEINPQQTWWSEFYTMISTKRFTPIWEMNK